MPFGERFPAPPPGVPDAAAGAASEEPRLCGVPPPPRWCSFGLRQFGPSGPRWSFGLRQFGPPPRAPPPLGAAGQATGTAEEVGTPPAMLFMRKRRCRGLNLQKSRLNLCCKQHNLVTTAPERVCTPKCGRTRIAAEGSYRSLLTMTGVTFVMVRSSFYIIFLISRSERYAFTINGDSATLFTPPARAPAVDQ